MDARSSPEAALSPRRVVAENPGYAHLGGPALAVHFSFVGAYLFATTFGPALAFVVYTLGWTLVFRAFGEDGASPSQSDDGETRRERDPAVETGGPGGSGGG